MIDDPAMWPWAVAIGVLGTIGTVIVGIYTARSAKAANRESSQLGGWRDMVKALQEDVARLRAERAEDERRYNADLDLCNRRINGLAEKIEASEQRERALVLWARRVIELMQTVEVEFPPPPVSIHDTGPNRVVDR
jgi:hypothetical protein